MAKVRFWNFRVDPMAEIGTVSVTDGDDVLTLAPAPGQRERLERLVQDPAGIGPRHLVDPAPTVEYLRALWRQFSGTSIRAEWLED